VRKLLKNQTGDTIVEVLLAVAIIAGVLAVSYATMNRNLVNIRDNQERTEATKLAQGQLESLFAKWRSDAAQITSLGSGGFCINDVSVAPIALGGSAPNTDPTVDNLIGDYGSCRDGFYSYGVKVSDASTNTYTAYVRWERVGGGLNQVLYAYRLGSP
jgi:type II secretory pathway pseudopilin PulG